MRRRTNDTAMVRMVMRGALVALLCVAGLGACGDSTQEKLAAVKLGASCSLDSECTEGLVCIFARCHVQCKKDSDCKAPPSQRCIVGQRGMHVCQLEDETECERKSDCPEGLVCAVDRECRDSCEEPSDCVGDQLCTPSGQCASSDSKKDTLGPGGALIPKATGGASGTGGAGPSLDSGPGGASSGGAEATGGTGSGGTPETGGTASGGSETGGAASGGAASGGADAGGGSGDFVEPGDEETTDNDTHENAVLVQSSASVYLPAGDVDWLKVRAPATGGAYVLEITADHQPGASSSINARDGVNRDQIAFIGTDGPAIGRLFLTVRAGTVTYLEIRPGRANAGDHRIDLSFSFTPENDAHEPNDTRESAAPITVNTDVQAQCMRAYVTLNDQRSDDWYKVTLQAGPATLLLKDDTGDQRTLFYFSGQGSAETFVVQTPSASTSFPLNAPTAGEYYVHVTHGGNTSLRAWASASKPAYMTDPYVFQVQQGQ